jgi:hypothetical protein
MEAINAVMMATTLATIPKMTPAFSRLACVTIWLAVLFEELFP